MTLSEAEMLEFIKLEIKKLGSQKAVAQQCGVSEQYFSDTLNGRRDITDKISAPLGYKRKIVFEKIES